MRHCRGVAAVLAPAPGRRRAPEVEQSAQAGALPERVRELGEWIVDCATTADFLARVNRAGS